MGTENVAHSRLGGKPNCGRHVFHDIEEDVLFSGGKVYAFMASWYDIKKSRDKLTYVSTLVPGPGSRGGMKAKSCWGRGT